MAESKTLFVTCHSSQRGTGGAHRPHVCLEPEVPAQVCQVGAMARQGQLRLCHCHRAPRAGLAHPLSFISVQAGYSLNLGLLFVCPVTNSSFSGGF